MKHRSPLLQTLAVVALVAQASLTTRAQIWQTVLDHQFVVGQPSEGWCITSDALGNVFSAGDGYDTSRISHGIVLKTDLTELTKLDPSTVNWTFSDDSDASPSQYATSIHDLAAGANGRVYSVGSLNPNCHTRGCPGSSWFVRRSPD